MSIENQILDRIREGRLVRFAQIMPRLPDIREIYLTPEINQEIEKQNPRFSHARALLDTFLQGGVIVARWPPGVPGEKVTAMMALLDPSEANVWEFRVRKPPRGLRIFGRFAAKDIFVGTHWYLRETLPKDNDWTHQIKLCRHEWQKLFLTYRPLTGTSIHDFISNARLPP